MTINDGTIEPASRLLRRIHPSQIVDDERLGRRRPSSAAFKDPELSVDVEPFLHEQGLDHQFCLQSTPGYSLAAIVASGCTALGLLVRHSPVAGNAAHAEVHGKKTGSISNQLALQAAWVVQI